MKIFHQNPSFLKVILLLVFAVTEGVLLTDGLGSASTIAITYGSNTVCGILAGKPNQRIECYTPNKGSSVISIEPNISYDSISGGKDFFCGLRSGGYSFLCWTVNSSSSYSPTPKRIYYDVNVTLRDIAVGENHVCGIENATGIVHCWWRQNGLQKLRYLSPGNERFSLITSGNGFSCGVLISSNRVKCWGIDSNKANGIEKEFGNVSMGSLTAGSSHVCGVDSNGVLVCKGNNDSGQLNFPWAKQQAFEYSGLGLGLNHSCVIRRLNGSVVCWGGNGMYSSNRIEGVSFESIVAGLDYTCGLTTRNLSMICWGLGWFSSNSTSSIDLPLPKIVPGACTLTPCGQCGIYPDSENLCSSSGSICKQCDYLVVDSPSAPPPSLPPPSKPNNIVRNKALLAYIIIGSFGIVCGIFSLIYCLWSGVCCCNRQKIHNSVQPTINRANSNNRGSGHFSPTFSISSKRHSFRAMRRTRSGPSSKHADRAEEFSLAELAAATNGFSIENKIGSGSFGIVYKGKLRDGREVAIKRGETSTKTKKFQEKESAFDSELEFLSRLHHKHLVSLVGFCEENEERLLVYEYMKNGALYDHIHSKNNVEKTSSLLNTWKMRIKVSLDAARGIEYLHNYAVPPIIHRDIKSSNILLDSNWVARVSDFGLSLLGPETEGEHMSAKAAGTVGYMDPEYYGLNVLTAKSDVYGLGVVMLELLTGKKAIFRDDDLDGEGPMSVVDYAVPKIMAGELERVLDVRVGPPDVNMAEAVELVAYTAVHCVNLEGKERPSMNDIVANLERALSLCDGSHGSISSASLASE
ncbi:hypothetical protein MKW94_003785 [Papaver nudicaule]|uniref:non-specific serine/threonine protein kinase n=1 Tax=Papaver nudicaule TaxID=74823 RepID=A0AA41UZN4_PAPNU|nr:hypothetical protein [Papaver nudicaule]